MSSSLTHTHPPTDADVVSVSALHLSVTIDPDHWGRLRPQPANLSLQLHLAPSYLNESGRSDKVADSLHYGHLAKAVERRVDGKAEKEVYTSARALLEDVTDGAFGFVADAVDRAKVATKVVHAVRVVLQLPKQILLAGAFEVELTTPASDWVCGAGNSGTGARSKAGAIVRVTNLILPVSIGVNKHEYDAKQRVIVHLTFFEDARPSAAEVQRVRELDYPAIIKQIVTKVESANHYSTLEKLVYEIIQIAYGVPDAHSNSDPNVSRIQAITIRCQKPSALSFADASEVEMTRTRETWSREMGI